MLVGPTVFTRGAGPRVCAVITTLVCCSVAARERQEMYHCRCRIHSLIDSLDDAHELPGVVWLRTDPLPPQEQDCRQRHPEIFDAGVIYDRDGEMAGVMLVGHIIPPARHLRATE